MISDASGIGVRLRAGLARIADVLGMTLLALLVWEVLFGGSQAFERQALIVGAIGVMASWLTPGSARWLPRAMLAYVGVALLSSMVHRWATVRASQELHWWALFTPASHLLVMAIFVAGAAHLLRSASRLLPWCAGLAVGVLLLSGQVLYDRVSTNFVYAEGGSESLPSVAQWGGMHQVGMLMVIGLPLVMALAFFSRSWPRIAAGALLGAGLMLVAIFNGSRSAIVAMALSVAIMAAVRLYALGPSRRMLVACGAVAVAVIVGVWLGLAQVQRARPPLSSVTSGRLPIWTAAWHVMRDHPLLGVGPGNYRLAMLDGGYGERHLPHYRARPHDRSEPAAFIGTEQAHNLLLHVGAETGVVGALSLLAWWLSMVWGCLRALIHSHLKLLSSGLAVALSAFLLRSMYDNFLDALITTDRTRVLIWTLCAAALALQRLTPRRAIR